MKKIFLSLVAAASIFLSGLTISAQNVSEERTVSSFSSIDLRIAGEVFVKQESSTKLRIEAPENVIKDLITEVSGGTLIIKFNLWKVSYKDIKIYVSTPNINGLEVSGSGSIIAESSISTEKLELAVSGSGKIKIENLTVKEIESDISGSGEITLAGPQEANRLEFDISGSGDMLVDGLKIKEIEAEISGSGKANVFCTEKLEADISGSGKIRYKGNPRVNADISGSGSVRQSE